MLDTCFHSSFTSPNLSSVAQLRDLPATTTAATPTVDVELAAVTFIDSTVISVLVSAHHAATLAGGALTLLYATGQVKHVLSVTGILPLLGPDSPPTLRA
ncbi:STAS domain-containing protein [Micromonospora endolithica]|uniref:Anti-sigma factor antagonist n=1 Tax=Micromonospora endolithica TaxID=230091 RepID=A0A3A9ZIF6_9ACTN|nr:STAS domain-containing protein [Micromonospora endolithica]RKN48211.1 anti-sigma factor antagonist [Micromonospora endolithica]TWJ24751.1 anti-anti-sigma factor [Micromonospora endolithica]